MTSARRQILSYCCLYLFLIFGFVGCTLVGPQTTTTRTYLSALTAQDEYILSDHALFNDEGYRTKNYRAPVPSIAPHAVTLSTFELQQSLAQKDVLAIDVLPTPFRAGQFVDTTNHHNIPGSIWLPNIGKGELDSFTAEYFAKKLHELTQGNTDKALVFYCKTDCWMSWNAVKRAAEKGYQNLYWYPDGVDGWQSAGGVLVPAQAMQP